MKKLDVRMDVDVEGEENCLAVANKQCMPKASLEKKSLPEVPDQLETGTDAASDLEEYPVFVNPLSDAGFKILFGNSGVEETESNQNDNNILKEGDLLKDMLNAFFDKRIGQIKKIKLKSVEVMGKTIHHRKVIYDLYFDDGNRREFVVMMQNREIPFLLDRTYNFTIAAHAQATMNCRDIRRQHSIVSVVIANFDLYEDVKMPCISVIENGDTKAGIVALDSTKILTVELTKFNKNVDELVDKKEVYLYLLKNLGAMKEVPVQLDTPEYRPIFENARIANLKKEDYMIFDEERTQERKRQLEMETAVDKAVVKAVEKERKKANSIIATLIREKVMPLERIATLLGVPINEVQEINNSIALA